MSSYPAPRYPKLKRPKSVEELMPKARKLINEPQGKFDVVEGWTSYGIKAGDKVLFVVRSDSDHMVMEAMCKAIRENGARVDLLKVDSTPFAPPPEWAAQEAIAIGKEEGWYSDYYTKAFHFISIPTVQAMIESEQYTFVIAGFAGPRPPDYVQPWRFFRYHTLENFVGPSRDLPGNVLKLMSDKVCAQVTACEVISLTDPEGSDIKWTNYNDKRAYIPHYILAKPENVGYGFGGKDDTTGVIAGTTNNLGLFPHLKAYIEGGQVVNVEGGGKYGEIWKEKIEKYRTLKLPPFPMRLGGSQKYEISDPGYFWFFECAIGNVPGDVPSTKELLSENYCNMASTMARAGHIHCGFGPPCSAQGELIKADLPWTHLHIHCRFATLQGTTEEGEIITIIDKGHLTALDDPEVRSLAARYGNPDELLTEAWIPAIPGINLPGDYMKDYGQDPISWFKKQAVEHPIWIG